MNKTISIDESLEAKEEYYQKEAVHYSRIKLIDPDRGGSPTKYREGLKELTKPKPEFQLGKAFHIKTLEPNLSHMVEQLPGAFPSEAIQGILADMYKESKQNVNGIAFEDVQFSKIPTDISMDYMEELFQRHNWRQAKTSSAEARAKNFFIPETQNYADLLIDQDNGVIHLSPEDMDRVNAMTLSVNNNKAATRVLAGAVEIPIYWTAETPHGTLQCKSLIDCISSHGGTDKIVDLKSTSDSAYDGYRYVRKWGTDLQLAFYGKAYREALKKKGTTIPNLEYIIVLTESKEPYETVVYDITELVLDVEEKVDNLLERVAYAERYPQDPSFEEMVNDGIIRLHPYRK